MAAIQKAFRTLFAWGSGISMALVFAIIFVNSLRRYTIGKSLEWGEELPIYLTIYGVMFGLGYAYLQDRHIRFTVVTDFLTDRQRLVLFAASDVVTAVVGALLTWSGIVFATRRGEVEASGLIGTAKDLAATTGIDGLVVLGQMGTYQYAIAVGGAILAIAAVLRLISRLGEIR